MRGGIQLGKVLGLKGTGTPSALILSLDLLQFRFQQLQAARRGSYETAFHRGSSETAPHRVSRPPAHSPSSHRTVLLASTALTSRLRSSSPASTEPSPLGSLSPAAGRNRLQTGLGGFHPKRHS